METIHQRQYRFPFHSDTVRIMATDLNKTSLFHVASNNTARRFCRDEPLGRIGETVSAVYRGEELRHDDELVLMQLMQVARGKYPYEWFSIFSVPFFKGSRGVTRRASSKDIDSVMESLARMRGGYLVVKSRSNYITVNLIKDLAGSGSNHHVQIDPALIILYSSFTALDTDHLFKTSGVARQLLKYISTIPSEYEDTRPIKITSLFELCYGTLESLERHYRETNPGKTNAQVRVAMSKKLSDFRRKNLPAGLDNLKEMNIIRSYELDESTDKVVISRNPDASPVRVLAGPSA
ncbi:TrfA family protein [Burkholderia pseudomallei]|nr:TrfA family protein [Burkholderia pseudomallei]CAJ6692586.1 TrfA family protein [Burkholderia pseudomallei]